MSSQRRQPQRAQQHARAVAAARAVGGPPSNAAQLDRLRGQFTPRSAQELLARLGFGREIGSGWDRERREALAAFQAALGLPNTGQLDPHTEAALQQALSARVSFRELLAIAPELEQRNALQVLPGVNTGMARADVNNTDRKAAFLAHIAHESQGFAQLQGQGGGLLPPAADGPTSTVAMGQAAAERWTAGGFNALADAGAHAQISAQLGVPAQMAASLRGHVRDVLARSHANPSFFDALPPGVTVDDADGPTLLWAETDEALDAEADTAPPARAQGRSRAPQSAPVVPNIGDFL